VGGRVFEFELSAMGRQLMELGGIIQAFHRHGKTMFQTMVGPTGVKVFHSPNGKNSVLGDDRGSQLAW
jgi:hypothetical protein